MPRLLLSSLFFAAALAATAQELPVVDQGPARQILPSGTGLDPKLSPGNLDPVADKALVNDATRVPAKPIEGLPPGYLDAGDPITTGDQRVLLLYSKDALLLLAQDAASKVERWRAAQIPFLTSGAPRGRMSADAEGRIYLKLGNGILRAYSATGNPLWERSLYEELGVQPAAFFGGNPPRIQGNEVIVEAVQQPGDSPGKLSIRYHSFDKLTGELLWAGNEAPEPAPDGPPGKPVALRVVPAEFSLEAGQSKTFDVMSIDAQGREVAPIDEPAWKVLPALPGKDQLAPLSTQIATDAYGRLAAADEAEGCIFRVTAAEGKLQATALGRVFPELPLVEDFEGPATAPERPPGAELGVMPGTVPAWWLGANPQWRVIPAGGGHTLLSPAKPTPTPATLFLGSGSLTGYTIQADFTRPEGESGDQLIALVNQRFLAVLDTKLGQLSLARTLETPLASAPANLVPGTTHTLRLRVEPDAASEGNVLVGAKFWPRGQPEPAAWTVQTRVPNPGGVATGAPGLLTQPHPAIPSGAYYEPDAQKHFSTVLIDNVIVIRNTD